MTVNLWFPEQQEQHLLGSCYLYRDLHLTPELVNQKLWSVLQQAAFNKLWPLCSISICAEGGPNPRFLCEICRLELKQQPFPAHTSWHWPVGLPHWPEVVTGLATALPSLDRPSISPSPGQGGMCVCLVPTPSWRKAARAKRGQPSLWSRLCLGCPVCSYSLLLCIQLYFWLPALCTSSFNIRHRTESDKSLNQLPQLCEVKLLWQTPTSLIEPQLTHSPRLILMHAEVWETLL